MTTQRLPTSRCAMCLHPIDTGTASTHGGLSPGDVSVCAYCGDVSALGDDMRLRILTDAEMDWFAGDDKFLEYMRTRSDAWNSRRGK